MNEFVPRGYLTLERALEHFGQLRRADESEAEKASSKRAFQQHLFAAELSAEVLTNDGVLHSLRSSIWGGVEAERIFETGRASISVGDIYIPDSVHGRVLIKQSSIDALFDDDSVDPSQSPDSQHEPQKDAEAPQPDAETPDWLAGADSLGQKHIEVDERVRRTLSQAADIPDMAASDGSSTPKHMDAGSQAGKEPKDEVTREIEPGRPSLKTEIEDACKELITNKKANLNSRKPNYEPIRKIIRQERKLPSDAHISGLGDEAIRKVIAPILDDALAALKGTKTASH